MPSLYRQFFDAAQFGAPYAAPEEHLLDLVRWCELLLTAYLPCYAPQIPWEGTPEEIKSNPLVIEAYLGREDD